MKNNRVVVTAMGAVTPYGVGIEKCLDEILNGNTALKKHTRFSTENMLSSYAGLVPFVDETKEASVLEQMVLRLKQEYGNSIPKDGTLFLATTTGEIDLLERDVRNGAVTGDAGALQKTLEKFNELFGLAGEPMLVSAACASSNVAITQAATMIKSGGISSAVVLGCDCVSEFVGSGFSSLRAMSDEPSTPFDKNRKGLTVGEAAGFMVLMSETEAMENKERVVGVISGWGMSNDANHITGPSRDGEGLARAIDLALKKAELTEHHIDMISAHGTGTNYNDAMEFEAFKTVFSSPKPAFSLKGAIGHTMGASGIIEAMISILSMDRELIPPTLALQTPLEGGEEWFSNQSKATKNLKRTLSVNSGFGGINTAIIIELI